MQQGNLLDYKQFVDNGVKLDNDSFRERMLLGAVGLSDECGEVTGLLKKLAFHGRTLDPETFEKLVLELGDVLWYFFLILHTFDIDFGDVLEANVHKLVNRYPDKHPDLLERYYDHPEPTVGNEVV